MVPFMHVMSELARWRPSLLATYLVARELVVCITDLGKPSKLTSKKIQNEITKDFGGSKSATICYTFNKANPEKLLLIPPKKGHPHVNSLLIPITIDTQLGTSVHGESYIMSACIQELSSKRRMKKRVR